MMMKKQRKAWLALPLLLSSLIFHSPAAVAVDCTKAAYAQTPACLALHKAGPEEVNSFSALAQKAAAQAAARAAAAKGITPTFSATTPLATVAAIPKSTPTVNPSAPTPNESVIPVTVPTPVSAKSSKSTKTKSSKTAKSPVVPKQATAKKPVTPKKIVPKKAVKQQAEPPAQGKPSESFVNKVVTVECTNGKKSVKVTSAKPMCPAGYWRK